MYKLFFTLLFLSNISYGLSFNPPKTGNVLLGNIKTTQIQAKNENFSDIAAKFDVGYYEIFEANPGINPDTPPTGTVLIVPTQYILPSELKKNTIVINLAEMRLYYWSEHKNKIYIFPIGIGKENWETPTGEMTIIRKIKQPTWIVPSSIYNYHKSIGAEIQHVIPPGPNNPMGSYALGLSRKKYFIHGTNLTSGVGRRSTAGCIRLYEEDIKQLYDMVNIGTPVTIINKPYKAGWVASKLYLEAHMPLLEQRLELGDNDTKPAFDVVSEALKSRNTTINWSKVTKIAQAHLAIPLAIN